MQESGLTFLAQHKKKSMLLGIWTLASKKSCDKGQAFKERWDTIQTLFSCFFLLKWHIACIVNAQVKVYNCLLFRRCDCAAKLCVTHHIRQLTTWMECARMHTMTSHKNDKSKYLSYHQRNAIHTAVSANSQAKPTEVRRNLKNFSPSKHVGASRLKSVGYALWEQRDTLAVNELYWISVDDTVQSVHFFCQSAWLGDLIARHNEADDLFLFADQ